MQPGVEAIEVAQSGQVPPAADERLLDGVLRAVWVLEDESGRGVQSTDRGACQHGEGVMIALACPLHEVSLHDRPWVSRDRSGRVRVYWLVASPNRSISVRRGLR